MTMREIPNLLASVSEWALATGAPDFGGPLFPPGATSDEKKRSHLKDLRPKTEPPYSAIRARTQIHDHCADCAVGECEEPANERTGYLCESHDRLTDLSIDQPPDGEIPRTRHPNDWWEL